MSIDLPQPFHRRVVTMEDSQAIAEMIEACDLVDIGTADYSQEELLDDWQRPYFSLERDACVVLTPEQQIVGYTDVCFFRDGILINPNTQTHPAYRHRGIEAYLYVFAEERAHQSMLERVRERSAVPKMIWTISVNDLSQQILLQRGFHITRQERHMSISFHEKPAEPLWPEGITMRTFLVGQDERVVHQIIQDAFVELADHGFQPFEEWEKNALKRKDFDPTLTFLAIVNGEAVGVLMSYASPSGGWIRQVAVAQPFRKRGLGTQLLRTAFSEFYQRGIDKVGLVVDPHNVTGAPRVYERVGMQTLRRYDTLEKPFREKL